METVVFRIEGMGCSCEGSILEKRVKKLRGVESFALNAFTNQLKVSYDPSVVTMVDVQESVKKAGVKAILVEVS
jgi:Cu+-exporting ATPase